MITKSGQMSVPVIVIDDQIIVGFNQGRIDELLAKESPGAATPPPAEVKPPEA
jgi:glutaredoxin